MVFSKSNAILKIIFFDKEKDKDLNHLDLRMVSEIKRQAGGGIEVKLQNRVELLKLLAQHFAEEKKQSEAPNEAESFFAAMDKAATSLKDEEK
jgi:hypothetical protein